MNLVYDCSPHESLQSSVVADPSSMQDIWVSPLLSGGTSNQCMEVMGFIPDGDSEFFFEVPCLWQAEQRFSITWPEAPHLPYLYIFFLQLSNLKLKLKNVAWKIILIE